MSEPQTHHCPSIVAAEFKMMSCGGDLLGATWHQLRVYHALIEAGNEIEQLRSKIERIRNYAMGAYRMSDVDRILAIAKECEADQDSEVSDG